MTNLDLFDPPVSGARVLGKLARNPEPRSTCNDSALSAPAVLTEAQRRARDAFDLDAAMSALPSDDPSSVSMTSHRGRAGVRLRAHLTADISDALLREFAATKLGAKRCSEQYLDALRIALGNQADAERFGYMLEMNIRVSFAPERVMRSVINQMRAAGITFGVVVGLGSERSQVVQCYWRERGAMNDGTSREIAEKALEMLYRKTEGERTVDPQAALSGISDADVPY